MRKWIRGWNPRGKDGTWEDGILVEKMGQGRMEPTWKRWDRGGWNPRGKDGTLAAIFGEFAWHSVIDGIGAFF